MDWYYEHRYLILPFWFLCFWMGYFFAWWMDKK